MVFLKESFEEPSKFDPCFLSFMAMVNVLKFRTHLFLFSSKMFAIKARFFLLVDLQVFFFRLRVKGDEKK